MSWKGFATQFLLNRPTPKEFLMRINRRQFVLGSTVFLTGCKIEKINDSEAPESTPTRAVEPADWQPEGEEDLSIFAWGVQAGDVSESRVILSFRTTATDLELVVVEADGGNWVEFHRQSLQRQDETVQFSLEGLRADQSYRYVVYDFETQKRSRVGRFRTPPTERRVLVIGATSCLGGNEPWSNLIYAAKEKFDCFLLLGDTVYADGAVSLEDYRTFWRHAMSVQGLSDVTASTSIFATWDDHEVGNNWLAADLAPGQYEDALQAYRESLPQTTGSQGSIWRKMAYGPDLDLFILDCRSERTETLYLSVEQMDWLKAQLSTSTARFKIILNSVPINDYTDMLGDALAEDRWQGYPTQREEILSYITDNAITGVLWLSGDVHHAMINHPDAPGEGPGDQQWEVAAGPSGSTLNVVADLYKDTTGHYTVLFAEWNYTRLTLDPGTGRVLVQFIGDDGSVLAEQSLEL